MRTVHCRRYNQEMPGLEAQPMPGDVGLDIFENVSAQAWQEWQTLQTMLINEHHLSLRDADARQFLQEQMGKFFRNEATELPEGYIKPEDQGAT